MLQRSKMFSKNMRHILAKGFEFNECFTIIVQISEKIVEMPLFADGLERRKAMAYANWRNKQ